MSKLFSVAAVALFAAYAATPGFAADVKVDGSSTVFPITEAMAEEFQISTGGEHRVTVGLSGTGGGFKKFCRGDTHISDASRPIRESERKDCAANNIQYIELPVAYDALTVVVNPQNTWVDHLTVDELKRMWEPSAQAKVKSWKQIRSSFPDRPLHLFGAGVDSGTYDYFTLATVGVEHSSRGDFTASEDDNVLVQGVAGDVNALGFFGLAYFVENKGKLKGVPIAMKAGAKAVAPAPEHVLDSSYQPLSRPIFIYVRKDAADKNPAVRQFVEFYLNKSNAKKLVREVGYVPLPDEAYDLAMQNFRARHTGTAFAGGSKIGVKVADLLKAQKTH
ncbi:MAG: PstS family phosphate ABC transporter substrate-binding protein [Alphaproteobacteria bacterium]